jgi:hypothetical protein
MKRWAVSGIARMGQDTAVVILQCNRNTCSIAGEGFSYNERQFSFFDHASSRCSPTDAEVPRFLVPNG